MSNTQLSDAQQRVIQRANNILNKNNELAISTHELKDSTLKMLNNPVSFVKHDINGLYLPSNAPLKPLTTLGTTKTSYPIQLNSSMPKITLTNNLPSIENSRVASVTKTNVTSVVPANLNTFVSTVPAVLTTTVPSDATLLNSTLYLKNNGATFLKLNLASDIFDSTFNAKPIASVSITKNLDKSIDLSIMFENSTGTLHYPSNPLSHAE